MFISLALIVVLCWDDKVLSEHGFRWLFVCLCAFCGRRFWREFLFFLGYKLREDRETKCRGRERLHMVTACFGPKSYCFIRSRGHFMDTEAWFSENKYFWGDLFVIISLDEACPVQISHSKHLKDDLNYYVYVYFVLTCSPLIASE